MAPLGPTSGDMLKKIKGERLNFEIESLILDYIECNVLHVNLAELCHSSYNSI